MRAKYEICFCQLKIESIIDPCKYFAVLSGTSQLESIYDLQATQLLIYFNSLVTVGCCSNFESVISKHILWMSMSPSCSIALWRMIQNIFHDETRFALGNGLVPVRYQAITWANADPGLCLYMLWLDHNELIIVIQPSYFLDIFLCLCVLLYFIFLCDHSFCGEPPAKASTSSSDGLAIRADAIQLRQCFRVQLSYGMFSQVTLDL